MKYPIDADKYIAAMRLEFGTDPDTEQAYREYIPLVNSAYQSGRDNAPGYPMDPEATLAEFEEKSGPAPAHCPKAGSRSYSLDEQGIFAGAGR